MAGFTSFSIHAGGPPLHAFLVPQRMHRTTFQATGICFFFVVNWSPVLPYAWLGQWTADNPVTSALPLPRAPVGVARSAATCTFASTTRCSTGWLRRLARHRVKLLYDASLAA